MTNAPTSGFGNTYVATMRNYELEEDQLRLVLSRDYTSMAYAVNNKTNGIFETVETQDGEQFFGSSDNQQKKRYVFRMCFSVPAIAKNTSGVITHGIAGLTQFTRIYGTCITDAPDFRPIPHASVTVNANIEVIISSTTITINNGAASPNITSGIVVLEYLKQ